MFHRTRLIGGALFWLLVAVVGWLSTQPLEALPKVDISDKWQHFAAYGALAFLGCWGHGATARRMIVVTLAVIAYGALLEGIQATIPNRQMSFLDFLANTGGAVMGAYALGLLRRRVDRQHPDQP